MHACRDLFRRRNTFLHEAKKAVEADEATEADEADGTNEAEEISRRSR